MASVWFGHTPALSGKLSPLPCFPPRGAQPGLARVLSWVGASRRLVGSPDVGVGLGGAVGGSR